MSKEYTVTHGDIEPSWPMQALAGAGLIQVGTIREMVTPATVEEEERGISAFDPRIESPTFDRNRQHFKEALRATVRHFFEKHDLPRSGGLDIGSGATGSMVHGFLEGTIQRNSWTETDLNPRSVEANKKLHPDSRVYVGSYHNLGALNLDGNLDIVTGLSTLDATQFVPHAIGQIRQALRTGGYLLHVQDVRPGNGTGIREMKAMGLKPPYQVALMKSPTNGQDFMAFNVNDKAITCGEMFRRQLDRAFLEDRGFEVLANDWVRSAKKISGQVSRTYYLNCDIRAMGTNPSQHEAYSIVTLARKK